MQLDFDVIIIGAGVAGMTAALYLKRANKKVCILEKEMPGGQINRTSTIENYPGIESITGPELAENMLHQIQKIGAEYRYGDVETVVVQENAMRVVTTNEILNCKYVIVATGRSPKKLNIENEDKLQGRGISWCAICDGPLYKNKKVTVVGGGASALEEALYLAAICEEVTILNRGETLRAPQYLQDKIKLIDNIKVLYNTLPKRFIEEENKLGAIEIYNPKAEERSLLKTDACFIYIGQQPNTECIKNFNILDEKGYIQVDEYGETKIPNLFAIGDVTQKGLYQIVTATADGAKVATTIIERS